MVRADMSLPPNLLLKLSIGGALCQLVQIGVRRMGPDLILLLGLKVLGARD
jgi:hypothetical protein